MTITSLLSTTTRCNSQIRLTIRSVNHVRNYSLSAPRIKSLSPTPTISQPVHLIPKIQSISAKDYHNKTFYLKDHIILPDDVIKLHLTRENDDEQKIFSIKCLIDCWFRNPIQKGEKIKILEICQDNLNPSWCNKSSIYLQSWKPVTVKTKKLNKPITSLKDLSPFHDMYQTKIRVKVLHEKRTSNINRYLIVDSSKIKVSLVVWSNSKDNEKLDKNSAYEIENFNIVHLNRNLSESLCVAGNFEIHTRFDTIIRRVDVAE